MDGRTSKEIINEDIKELIKKYKTDKTRGERRYLPTTKSKDFP